MNEFLNLVKEIADELGGWEYKPRYDDYNSCYERLSGPDGATIAITSGCALYRFDRGTARLEVYGQYPNYRGKSYHHQTSEPRITVAAKRGAVAIARDIKRRLLPDHLPLYAKVTAWVQQKVEAYDEGTANLTAVADALDVPVPINDSRRVTLRRYREEGTFGSFEATSGKFHVELHSVSLEKALAIAYLFSG